MMSQDKLRAILIERSESKDWQEAKKEWGLRDIWLNDEWSSCLCDHPIKEICTIFNLLNGNTAEVGNCCVKQFLGTSFENVFNSAKRVVADIAASFNEEAVDLAYQKGVLSDWEYQFYLSIWRKRNLSPKQSYYKTKINKKLLKHFVR